MGAPPLGGVTFVFFLTKFLKTALFRDAPCRFLLFVLCLLPPPSPPGHLLLKPASGQDTGEVTPPEDAQGRAGGLAPPPLSTLALPRLRRQPWFQGSGPWLMPHSPVVQSETPSQQP